HGDDNIIKPNDLILEETEALVISLPEHQLLRVTEMIHDGSSNLNSWVHLNL
ncbi:hypothetical protein AVEN_174958-1, partial [Araneus ventricosus]